MEIGERVARTEQRLDDLSRELDQRFTDVGAEVAGLREKQHTDRSTVAALAVTVATLSAQVQQFIQNAESVAERAATKVLHAYNDSHDPGGWQGALMASLKLVGLALVLVAGVVGLKASGLLD